MCSKTKKSNTKKTSKKNKGFSLVELLIALTIVLILASLAIPNFLDARARANEASAIGSLKLITSSQSIYHASYGTYTEIVTLGTQSLVDVNLANGNKSGYRFGCSTAGLLGSLEFSATASPVLTLGPSASGKKYYFTNESAVLRFSLVDDESYTNWPPIQ